MIRFFSNFVMLLLVVGFTYNLFQIAAGLIANTGSLSWETHAYMLELTSGLICFQLLNRARKYFRIRRQVVQGIGAPFYMALS